MRAVALLAALATGCSLGVFEDLRDQAPVDSNGPSDRVSSQQFPVAITGVPGIDGLRFVAAGNNPISVSSYIYSPADGALTIDGLNAPGIMGPDSDLDEPPTLIAFSGDDDDRGLVFLGNLDDVNRILVFAAGDANRPIELVDEITTEDCPGVIDLGAQMVFANTDRGDPEKPDLIFSGNRVDDFDRLLILEDYEPGQPRTCISCDMINQEGGHEMRINGLAAIDMLGEDFDQIVMTMADNRSAQPNLLYGFQVFNGSDIVPVPCFLMSNPLPIDINTPEDGSNTTDTEFGKFIAVGDFDGNDADDLAFTNPEDEVIRIHLNPTAGDAGPMVMLPTPPGLFEPVIAAGDVDNDDVDELVLGNPMAEVDGQSEAGVALVLELPPMPPMGPPPEPRRIHDSQPETRQRFGVTLAVGAFQRMGENVDVLIVGAVNEVFSVFAATPGAIDPRFPPPPP